MIPACLSWEFPQESVLITKLGTEINDFFSSKQGGFAEMVSYAVMQGIFYGSFYGLLRLLL